MVLPPSSSSLFVVIFASVIIMPASSSALKTLATFSLKTAQQKGERNLLLSIARGSVVDFASSFTNDAIVNAANEGCLGGGGVDGAITNAGGRQLHEDRLALPLVPNRDGDNVRCPTGTAVVTGPSDNYGTLQVNHVIHAVGPNYWTYEGFEEPDDLLKSAYQSSLQASREAGIQSVAFSLLSAGVFRGRRNLGDILKISIGGIRDWVLDEEDIGSLESVTLCGFSEKETSALLHACQEENLEEHEVEEAQEEKQQEAVVEEESEETGTKRPIDEVEGESLSDPHDAKKQEL